jgi:hypothetical protein
VNSGFRAPDFFVIGAQKAGTTTLHDRLVDCPLVNLPITKETHFFSDDEVFAKGIDWYERQFPVADGYLKRGEITPDYLFSRSAASRICAVNPKPDIICLFRQPLERAYSNYLMAVRNGYEQLSFSDALEAESERALASPRDRALFSYQGRSLYGEQLSRYLELLPEARYRFFTFEEFTDEGEAGKACFEEICNFIGVASCGEQVDFSIKSNPASKPRSGFLRNQLYGPSPIKRLLRLLIPSQDLRARIAYRLDRLNQTPIKKTPMGNVPESVIERLVSDLGVLEELTKLDLAHWKKSIVSHNQKK